MKHENEYRIITTEQGILILVIKSKDGVEKDPILIYDGRNNATLYRQPDQTIVIDNIPVEAKGILKNSYEIIISEVDAKTADVVRHYKARVKPLEKNPFVK